MSGPLEVTVSAATDQGLKRSHNEDSHGIWLPDDPQERERRGVLLVVADGMGGSSAGEVASDLAVRSVLRMYRDASGDDPLEALKGSVENANRLLHEQGQSNPNLEGMGTTCTAVVVRDRDLLLSHVGDSRAYVLHGGHLQQLSNDHSVLAQLVREGQLSPEEAKRDPRRNVVTRSLGVEPQVDVDAERLAGLIADGDTLLLCTDGLHGQTSDAELAELAGRDDLDAACREAVALANERGGPDNVTVLLARFRQSRLGSNHAAGRTGGSGSAVESTAWDLEPGVGVAAGETGTVPSFTSEARPPRATEASPKRRSRILMALIVAIVVLLLALVAIALVWRRLDNASRGLSQRIPVATSMDARA